MKESAKGSAKKTGKVSTGVKIRTALAILIGGISIVLFGYVLERIQVRYVMEDIRKEMAENAAYLEEIYLSRHEVYLNTRQSFRELYEQDLYLLESVLMNDPDFVLTDEYMKELCDQLKLRDVMVANRAGEILVSASGNRSSLKSRRYAPLRDCFEEGGVAEVSSLSEQQAWEMSLSGEEDPENSVSPGSGFYAYAVSDELAFVIEADALTQKTIEEYAGSWTGILKNETIGVHGFAFAWSGESGRLLYYPDETLKYEPVSSLGMDMEQIQSGTFLWDSVDGQRMYLYPDYYEAEDVWICCAVPENELVSPRRLIRTALWAVFALTAIDLIYYIILLMRQKKIRVMTDFTGSGKMAPQHSRQYKLLVFTIFGGLIMFLIAFYLQTLVFMSNWADSAGRQTGRIEKRMQENEKALQSFCESYDGNKKAQLALLGWYLEKDPERETVEILDEFCDILNFRELKILDIWGDNRVSNSGSAWQSSAAGAAQGANTSLLGKVAAQDEGKDLFSWMDNGRLILVPYKGQTVSQEGYLYAGYYSEKLAGVLKSFSLEGTLDTVHPGKNGLVFVLDREGTRFVYYPGGTLTGRDPLEYGLTKEQIRDNFCDYITIDNTPYYAVTDVIGTDLIYYVIAKASLLGARLPISCMSTAAALLLLLITGLPLYSMIGHSEKPQLEEKSPESRKEGNSAEFKVFRIMIYYAAAAAALFALYSTLRAGSINVLDYVMDGNWQHGLNVFSLTASIIILCKGGILLFLGRSFVNAMAGILPIRGGTILRMLASLVTYVGFALLAYRCMVCFGLNPTALMASAGIVSVIIGIGANSLVGDILAGIFLLMEGNIQVGDVVRIGDFRGYVQEMGIRMTKLFDMETHNIKIIPNKEVQNVVHMTMHTAIVYSTFMIGYDEDLERVEKLLKEELSTMYGNVPYIRENPRYLGVSVLDTNGVVLKVATRCHEAFRMPVERLVNRRIYVMFRRNGITIPYPQLVTHVGAPDTVRPAPEPSAASAENSSAADRK